MVFTSRKSCQSVKSISQIILALDLSVSRNRSGPRPALFTRMCGPPKAEFASSTIIRASSGRDTSLAMPMQPFPIDCTASSRTSSSSSTKATAAPAFARPAAMARPRPRPAPVTIADLPLRFVMELVLIVFKVDD